MSVIAEGVENEKQIAELIKLGVNEFQGYFFAKPMPRDELESFIINNEKMVAG